MVIKPEEQLDELPRAHHLGDKIEQHHDKGARCGKYAHRHLLEPVGHHIGKGEAPKIAQTLRQHECYERPAHLKADGVYQTVKARCHDCG